MRNYCCLFLSVASLGAFPSVMFAAGDAPDMDSRYEFMSPAPKTTSVALEHLEANPLLRGDISPLNTRKQRKSPLRADADMDLPQIFGWNIYSKNETPYGLYEFSDNALQMLWADSFYDLTDAKLSNGFLKDGKIIGLASKEFLGYQLAYYSVVYDYSTGDVLSSQELTIKEAPYYERLAYNPDDGYVYGIGKNYQYNSSVRVFMRSHPDDFTTSEVICELGEGRNMQSLCYCSRDKAFYGANLNHEFARIDTDGTYTPLFTLDCNFNPAYIGGLLFDASDNIFYWNYSTDDESYMASINDVTQQVEDICELEYANELSFFLDTMTTQRNPESPLPPEIKSVDFPDGALSGSITLTLPLTNEGGEALTGELECVAMVDGEVYTRANAEVGKELKMDFNDLARGKHTFGFYVSAAGKESGMSQLNYFIGFDDPLPPANVVWRGSTLKWDAVTEGVNNGYIDAGNVVYSISINGEPYSSTKENTIEINLPDDKPLATYTATVTALNGEYESLPASSNMIVAGEPLSLPMKLAPTLDEYNLCTVNDANGDGVYWIFDDQRRAFLMGYSINDSDCDDWLFLPPFRVENAEDMLSLEYEACIRSAMFGDEELAVYIGKEANAEDMTKCIVEKYCPATIDPDYQNMNSLFNVDEPGTYYIGFHLTSVANQMGVALRNISVEANNITDASPAPVADITAKAGEEGALEAEVGMTLPLLNNAGEALDADTPLEVAVTSSVETVKASGKPGEKVSVKVKTVQGDNELEAVVYSGSLRSTRTIVNVYTGVWAPMHTKVTSIQGAHDMMSVTIKWNPVTKGVDNGFIRPEDVVYDIYVYEQGILGSSWEYYDTAGKGTEYTYVCEPGMEQQVLQIGVVASNEAGNDGYVASSRDLVGTPFSLPMVETFGNDEQSVEPWVIYTLDNSYTASWSIGKIENIGEYDTDSEYALYALSQNGAGAKGMIGMPRFSTLDMENVKLVMDIYVGSNCADIKISGAGYYDTERHLLGTVGRSESGPDFRTVEMQLPKELLGQAWVQLYVEASFNEDADVVIITRMSVEEGVANDVAAVASTRSVTAVDGGVAVTGCAGGHLEISTLSGMNIVATDVVSDHELYRLEPGIYIVNIADIRRKIVVR